MKSKLILNSVLSLLIGCLIYLFFRNPSLIFFGWIDNLGLASSVETLQEMMSPLQSRLPSWALFSLPDGLWLLSYVCFMLHVWRSSMRWSGLIWTLVLPIFAILFEISQFMNPSLGTFDWVDLIFYFCATIFPFVIFRKRVNFNPNSKNIHEE